MSSQRAPIVEPFTIEDTQFYGPRHGLLTQEEKRHRSLSRYLTYNRGAVLTHLLIFFGYTIVFYAFQTNTVGCRHSRQIYCQ